MVSLSDVWVTVQPDTTRFEPTLRSRLQRVDFGSVGRKVGSQVGAAISKATADATGRGGLLKTATITRQATSVGAKAGTSLGTALAEKAAAKIGQPKIFSRFAAAATKAAKTAGAQMAIGAAREVSSRLSSAAKAGTSFGQRFGQSASKAAGSTFKLGDKGLAGLGGLKAGIAGLAVSLTGGAVLTGLKGLANAASDLNETTSKSRTIFGSSSKAIEAWARGAAKNLGLSRKEALDGASAFGNLFDQLGFGVKQSAKMSTGFAQMASDAASFNNANPAEVMDAFLSATRGEYDALQKYIPTASAATIEAEALRMTHKKSASDLTAADKAAALYSVSVRDLGKAHGDFARTAGGFANQQRIMAANWADLRVKIGNYFLPMFTKAAKYMNEEGFPALTRIVGALGEVGKSAGRMGRAVLRVFSTTFATAIDGATTNLTEIADWMETHQTAMIKFFIRIGDGAIGLGKAVTGFVVNSIRSFGDFSAGLAEIVGTTGPAIADLLTATAQLLPFGSKMKVSMLNAADAIRTGSASAAAGLRNTSARAGDAANAVANKAFPAFDKAGKALHRIGNEEIWKARQRDAAAKASIAIRDIGVKGDFARVNLKGFNIEGDKGTASQKAFRERVHNAANALRDQYNAAKNSGAKQSELNGILRTARGRLRDQFIQMGYTKKRAGELAAQYTSVATAAKKVPKRVGSKITWDTAVDDINTKLILRGGKGARLISAARGTVLPGFTPGHDVHRFVSSTGGQLDLSGGEAVMVPEWTRAVGGPKEVARMNAAARRRQAFASGGVFRAVHAAGTRAVVEGGTSAVSKLLKRLGPDFGGVGPIGSPAHVSNPRGIGHYGGGTFTRLFIAGLQQVAKAVGHAIHVTQGGFRPTTSYSGSTHNKDAIDTRVEMGVLRAFRKYVGAMGDRTGLGNWGAHMHGVPAPGRGYGSPSARNQYQDYLRRGGARQSPRSPWGLASGAIVRGGRGGIAAMVGEGRRDELVAPLPNNWRHGARAGSADVVELGPRSIAAIASALTVEIDGRQVARAVRYQGLRGTT